MDHATLDTIIIVAIGLAGAAGLILPLFLFQAHLRKRRPRGAALPREIVAPEVALETVALDITRDAVAPQPPLRRRPPGRRA